MIDWPQLAQARNSIGHRRATALLRGIHNITICMGKKPIVSVTYEHERISIKKQLTLLKMCVTSLLCGPRADLWVFMKTVFSLRRDVTHILSKVSCSYWNPFIFMGYRNDKFFSHTNPYISNVTQQCPALLVDAHISSLGYLWGTQQSILREGSAPRFNPYPFSSPEPLGLICNDGLWGRENNPLPLFFTISERKGTPFAVFKMWMNHKTRTFSRLFYSH